MIASGNAPIAAGGHQLVADDDAFAGVYAAQHDRLVRAAALITGSAAVAEELVQDAFAKLHVKWRRVEQPAAWLRRVVVNSAKNERRGAAVRRRYLERQGKAEPSHQFDEPVDDLIAALRQLPPRQRAVVVLRFYDDLPEAEIASTLGIRVGTVKSTLHRALAALRQEVHP